MTMIIAPPPQPPPPKSSPSTSDSDIIATWCPSMSFDNRTIHSIKNHSPMTRSVCSPVVLRFNPQVQVRYVPSLDDLTRQEQLDTWYSREDYKYIRRREHRLMRELSTQKVQVSKRNDENYFCRQVSLAQRVLGLQTSKERDARCQRIRKAQFLVLVEQERHGDPERLARTYSQISSESAEQARDRGLNVEIVLRNLELSSDSSHRRGRPECFGSAPNHGCATMRYRRWLADPSSSTSVLPVRDTGTTTPLSGRPLGRTRCTPPYFH